MITASNFVLDRIEKNLVARCNVSGPSLPKTLWFASETDAEKSLEIEEPNWAAVSLIYPAMGLGHDLQIDAPISPRLLYNLNHDFQSLLQTFNPNLKKIKVTAHSSDPKVYGSDVVRHSITGFSGGADSSATYQLYTTEDVPESMRISALSIYDVGALGKTPKDPTFQHLLPHFDGLRRFCDGEGIEAFGVASNLRDIFRPVRYHHPTRPVLSATISLRNIAATYAMQNRVKNYYPSGNSGFADLTVELADSIEAFEPVVNLLLSSETTFFQTGGGGLQRFEKLKLLADSEFAQRGLNVCVGTKDQKASSDYLNCGKCWKCIDTQIESDALGILDNFSAVFDVGFFRENRDDLLQNFVENSAYDERKLKLKLGTFQDLYKNNAQEIPKTLVELARRLSEANPDTTETRPKATNGALARFLARLR